jgi:hypothetical protein
MPGYLLHQGATVSCQHSGQAQPTATNPRVKVSDQPITTQAAPYTVAGCPFVAGTVASPCVTAQWTTAATRIKANGVPVLLQDSQAICAPNGTGVQVLATQMRVKGQ